MKASLKGRCEPGKGTAVSSLAFNAGDVKLRASLTDISFTNGPSLNGSSLNGLSLSVDKPGSFLIDYDLLKQDVRFQFMNTVRFLDKPLNLTYTHWRGKNRTALDGTVVFDSANKVSANYAFDSRNCKLKYSYVHGGSSTFEQSYDFAKNSLDFVVLKRLCDDDVVRASYQTSTKVLGLEWTRTSAFCGNFKFSAYLNLAEKLKVPKLCAESTWDIDM